MRLIEPSFEILTPGSPKEGLHMLQFIEEQARISHRSEDLQDEDTWRRFIKFVVVEKGDWSVVEHAYATVQFRIDRGLTHELVRHRLFSFTQESTRFVNYKKKGDLEFIVPSGLNDGQRATIVQVLGTLEAQYLLLIESGAKPQQARAILPSALAATIAVTGNLRNWHYFLMARTSQETHADLRQITVPLLAEFRARIPILFDDITPNQKQSIAQASPR